MWRRARFNKYYPPDYDGEKHKSLNAYRGKHALGDRARKLDQGILITRFELPFNIWCGTCNNHIGMGVRYNAEKRKVGAYYSTPIYSFRCKCHLCDGWFEIQTDPKNTRYVVVSGARQKDEEWNPEENGGFAIHDTEGASAPADPLAALEKSTDAQKHVAKVQIPRLESLQVVSDHYNSDPYTLSSLVRKRFRADKRVEAEKRVVDDQIKGRYGLPETLKLVAEDDAAKLEARGQWEKGRREYEAQTSIRKARLSSAAIPPSLLVSGSRTPSQTQNALSSLTARILDNTRRSSSFTSGKAPDRKLGLR
ncbi:CWC16 protein [Phlebopus sp. FC_14]|nr:CWC16 protein [Phlebopus sp. FC_14]